MIEKLQAKITEKDGGAFGIIVERRYATDEEMMDKINELVDAVNVLQAQVAILEEHAHPTAKTPVDPYAEQHKWIGKVCKFWDDSDKPENCVYDVLCNIFDLHHEDCPFQCGNGEWYEYCEPVKPDDDIIYKGE